MSKRPKISKTTSSNPFLDLEAVVADEEEEEEGALARESDEDFIDHGLDFEYEPYAPPSTREPLSNILDLSDGNDTENNNMYDSELDSDLEELIEDIAADTADDPYWRLACKAGMEKDVVEALERRAEYLKQGIRSTFHPTLRMGWVYLQAKVTKRLYDFLLNTKGVLRRGKKVVIRASTPEEFLGVLRSDAINTMHCVDRDEWVGVVRGAYKGDPAITVAVDGDLVDVVVIPRLNLTRKRKAAGLKHSPSLFDAVEYQQNFPGKIVHSRGEQLFSVGACDFEFGLLRLSLAWEAIDPTQINLPTQILDLFQRSGHPAVCCVIHIPKPLEWCINCGDQVLLPHKAQRGTVSLVGTTQVCVDVGEAGIIQTRWNHLRKAISVGNYVEIGAGPCKEAAGWVVNQVDQTCIVLQAQEGTNKIEEIPIHINWLKVATPPVHLPKPTRVLNSVVKEYMPWRNTRVIVIKRKDANTGKIWKIIDVVKHQESSRAGARLVVELEDYNPNLPFLHITVDSEDVVDAVTHLKLGQKRSPPLSQAPAYASTEWPSSAQTPMHPTSLNDSVAPAWDPISPANPSVDANSLLDFSNVDSAPSASLTLPAHPLLNPLLSNITFKTTVTGSKYTNSKLDVKVVNIDGHLSLQHRTFKTWNVLEPAWVQPQHPRISRDNSLLAVIEGEYVGQFARRVDNVEVDGQMLMMLACVTHSEGIRDTLMPGLIYLPPSSLCICSETDSSKKLNKRLMDSLCNDARKGCL
ncbi:hypothetical protein CVT24_001328 [Panaeolus cyanescens]|uniref:NGN domain-containing protein n=1 Tax=Panaeolus cyanescens TaxID=181874 RepID=A0A409WXH4_9AGAR|nr:hypothetical protein CVT24_001328 [Panaeolus cyanescens]